MKKSPINILLKVAIVATFSLLLFQHAKAQTNVFVSAMPRINHLNNFRGTQPASFQYRTMPISMNYSFGIEHTLKPTFSVQLGMMQNASKTVSETYLGSDFDAGEIGHGSGSTSSFSWETFLTLKQVVYSRNRFDIFVCAGASLFLQHPYGSFVSTTTLINDDAITGRDTVMLVEENLRRHKDYIPFAAHGQLGISKRFKYDITVSLAAMFYYAKPSYNLITTITWEDKVYQSRAVQQTYFGGVNVSVFYPIIKNKSKVFR